MKVGDKLVCYNDKYLFNGYKMNISINKVYVINRLIEVSNFYKVIIVSDDDSKISFNSSVNNVFGRSEIENYLGSYFYTIKQYRKLKLIRLVKV